MSSSGSLHELHTTSSGESHHAIQLHDIISVCRLDDGKPYFSIEINHMDEETNYVGAITLQLYDPLEYNVWTSSIRGAVTKARLNDPQPFSENLIQHTVRVLEREHDYDPHSFHLFKVIKRSGKSAVRSSSEDLTKIQSTVCVLAFGVHKMHLVPFPKSSRSTSNTSLSDMNAISHGLLAITHLRMHETDDAFSVTCRIPFCQSTTLYLASSLVGDIALTIRNGVDFLRPLWGESSMTWDVPSAVEHGIWTITPPNDFCSGYDRTLSAYCAAYDVDPSNIQYGVHDECEDAPVFELLPPANRGRTRYSALELLAIMRSLRYNESFSTLSFRNISLDVLHNLRDRYGSDHVPLTTKSGIPLQIPDELNATLLVQEIRALAVKCRRLRRLDVSYCLSRRIEHLEDDTVQDPGCGICEALFPICAKQWTNIDWIILNGIVITDVDIDYIFSAAIDKSCHFRALDVGYCGLVDRSMHTFLQAISHQGATMESINLSGNLARQEPEEIESHIGHMEFIRKINFSNVNRTSSPEPLISEEILRNWKLVELRLSGTALNEQTVLALTTYLMRDNSEHLKVLQVDQCRLTGSEAGFLLNAINSGRRKIRNMHLDLSENRLEQNHEPLVDAIGRSRSPVRLTMQMMEYKEEKNFQKLIEAFSKNTTTKSLDISKLSLPIDAGHDTCEILHRLFTDNRTIEEIDISGEHTHIEAAQYGNGLYFALAGLKQNITLKVLRVEHQKLGLQGASTLFSVLQENTTLREIYCENNEINLQAFTVLVNAVERNTTIQYLSPMAMDRAWSQRKVDKEIDNIRDEPTPSPVTRMSSSTRATVNRTLDRTIGRTLGSRKIFSPRANSKSHTPANSYTDTDFKAAMGSLSQEWDREVARLQGYLVRNYNLAHGLPPDGQQLLDVDRPETSDSLATAIQGYSIDDKTPTAEVDRQLATEDSGAAKKELNVEEKEVDVEENEEKEGSVDEHAYESEGDSVMIGKH